MPTLARCLRGSGSKQCRLPFSRGSIPRIPQTQRPTDENYVPELASLHALGVVGKALIFSEDRMQAHMDELFEKMSEHHSAEAIAVSRAYGQRVADAVLNWAQGDNYNQNPHVYQIRDQRRSDALEANASGLHGRY